MSTVWWVLIGWVAVSCAIAPFIGRWIAFGMGGARRRRERDSSSTASAQVVSLDLGGSQKRRPSEAAPLASGVVAAPLEGDTAATAVRRAQDGR